MTSNELQIVITADGTSHCIFDEIVDLNALGRVHIRRASHVEPTADGAWIADLCPVHGPRLGPFAKRSEALVAERVWLIKHWLAGLRTP